ncbi:tetratricopeptide repeat protein [Borrelia miyamotoi]|uniref:Tetratricopeptide repeat protein n=1 Tax=Borrelia miyamotoi TaxID=47466 RepID=A0AAX3JN21_9SPIR|nr:tetratricopeptide repeat protein [Borrelia miyamotoi]QFP42000.1 tetratricopeptide repeat protein [Borrelia miyamotoi]QFP48116.1 tetratricopeptide repeat protein [Borrelia miyamotoi]QGT55875.1 tetratricopeptide repeat protein [Borrelia miyamotoi]QGT56655.1 tetratricopeptide repeat protein [Borrelia miyamotoi]WAZ71916.1 tetratricopeptide repeat protein [Borrelia miyamotoi]
MKKLILTSLLFFSCYTAAHLDKQLTKETPYRSYLREAQKATNVNDYKSALKIYKKMIENYKENESIVATGKYEIAFIYYATNKKETAKKLFEEIIQSNIQSPKWIIPLSKKIIEKINN